MTAFATVAELEAFMATTGLGARGTAFLDYASAEIRSFCRQDLDAVSGRQEEFAALGQYYLSLTETPVTAVSAITENLVSFVDFTWDRAGNIYRTDWSTWEDGPILVTYDSGYGPASDEMVAIKAVCLEIAARALGGSQTGQEIFGSEIPELRGAPVGIFLTEGEERKLRQYEPVVMA